MRDPRVAGAGTAAVVLAAMVLGLLWAPVVMTDEGGGPKLEHREVQMPAGEAARPADRSCITVYYYDDTATVAYVWKVPQSGASEFAVRFDQQGSPVCTLMTAWVLLYGPNMTGTPDVEIVVYDDDGTGLPGIQLAAAPVPYALLPATGPGWIAADFSGHNLIFSEGENYHIAVRVSPAVEGDTVSVFSDAATGPYSGENHSTYYDGGFWWTLNSAVGTDYVFMIEAEVCCGNGPLVWDITTPRTLTYWIQKYMDADSIVYLEEDSMTLSVSIAVGMVDFVLHSEFYDTTEYFGPYAFGPDGSISLFPGDTVPAPLEADFLLNFLPSSLADTGRTGWEVLWMPDSTEEAHMLSLGMRDSIERLGLEFIEGSVLETFALKGYYRLLPNDGLYELLGPEPLWLPEVDTTVAELSETDNLWFIGKLGWDGARGATAYLECTYVPTLHSGSDSADVVNEYWYRQEWTARLVSYTKD